VALFPTLLLLPLAARGGFCTSPQRLLGSLGCSSMKRARSTTAAAASEDGVEERNARGKEAGKKKVAHARARGAAVINHGAGVMPVDAPAPFGGERYTLLRDSEDAPPPEWRDPHDGLRRHTAIEDGYGSSSSSSTSSSSSSSFSSSISISISTANAGKLYFEDAPDFAPLLTPAQCLERGIFGGCYFNPRGGKAGIFGRNVAIDVDEFPTEWFEKLDVEKMATSRRYAVSTNKYGVKAGQDQAFWESKVGFGEKRINSFILDVSARRQQCFDHHSVDVLCLLSHI
jgi:hypothetical protein